MSKMIVARNCSSDQFMSANAVRLISQLGYMMNRKSYQITWFRNSWHEPLFSFFASKMIETSRWHHINWKGYSSKLRVFTSQRVSQLCGWRGSGLCLWKNLLVQFSIQPFDRLVWLWLQPGFHEKPGVHSCKLQDGVWNIASFANIEVFVFFMHPKHIFGFGHMLKWNHKTWKQRTPKRRRQLLHPWPKMGFSAAIEKKHRFMVNLAIFEHVRKIGFFRYIMDPIESKNLSVNFVNLNVGSRIWWPHKTWKTQTTWKIPKALWANDI